MDSKTTLGCEFDFSKLKGLIVEKYDSFTNFSRILGIKNATLLAKLNGERRISPTEVVQWSELLSIASEDIGIYFFKLKV
jgi:hypothetical protein